MQNQVEPSWQPVATESATVCLTPSPDSHPFTERRIPVPQLLLAAAADSSMPWSSSAAAVRIGRASGQLRPAKDNGLFDCKVLSRCHAVLAYSASDGAFLLADTRSSNGTFVNGIRLERNRPSQLYTGDQIQLGVPVRCRDKPVFACIKARVELLHPHGRLASSRHQQCCRRPSRQGDRRHHCRRRCRRETVTESDDAALLDDELDDADEAGGGFNNRTELLARCLERAMQRERLLDLKLACLRRRRQQHQLQLQQQQMCSSSDSAIADVDDDAEAALPVDNLRLTWRQLSIDCQAVARLKSLAADAAEAPLGGISGSYSSLAEITNAAAEAWLAELDRGLAERQAMISRLADLEAQLDLGGRECQHLLARCDQIASMLSASSELPIVEDNQNLLHRHDDIVSAVSKPGSAVDTLAVNVQISLVEELLDYILDKTGICLDAVSGEPAPRPVVVDAPSSVTELTDPGSSFDDYIDDGQTLRRVIRRHHRPRRRQHPSVEGPDDVMLADDDYEDYSNEDADQDDEDYRLSESLLATERRVAELISRLDVERRRYLASDAELGESAQQLLEEMRQQARWLDESLKTSGARACDTAGAAADNSDDKMEKSSIVTTESPMRAAAAAVDGQIDIVLLQQLPSISALVALVSLTVYLLFYWL